MENTHLVFYPEASEFSKNTYEFEKMGGRYWIADGAIDSSSTPTLSQVRARSTGSSPAIRPRHDSSQHRIQQLEVSASITRHSLSYIPSL